MRYANCINFIFFVIFKEFTPLSNQHKAVNLGQGFPDWQTPDFVKKSLCDAVVADFNQYSRPAGSPELVTALANHYSPLVGRKIDPLNEVTVSIGATEGMYCLLQALVNEGGG